MNPALIVNDSLLAKLQRALHPGNGWCQNCGMPWAVVEGHVTPIGPTQGVFPLCTTCWNLLGAEAKLECYLLLVDQWEADRPPLRDVDTRDNVARSLARELGHITDRSIARSSDRSTVAPTLAPCSLSQSESQSESEVSTFVPANTHDSAPRRP